MYNKLNKNNLFDMVPVVGDHIATEKEGELSVIAFPRFRSKFMQKYFVPRNKSSIIRVRLEKHGTAVWELINGKRTVKNIVDALAMHFDHEINYEYRIAAYLRQLHRHGFIYFISSP